MCAVLEGDGSVEYVDRAAKQSLEYYEESPVGDRLSDIPG
jgi:hypothetical protein